MIGNCKRCGNKEELHGGTCENCRLEAQNKRQQELLGTDKKKMSREEIEQELAEHRKDKKFWWGKE